MYDIVNPRGLISVLAEQPDRDVDDLLPQAGFLPFPKSDLRLLCYSLCGHHPCHKRTRHDPFPPVSI
jgi:hypothetical protein